MDQCLNSLSIDLWHEYGFRCCVDPYPMEIIVCWIKQHFQSSTYTVRVQLGAHTSGVVYWTKLYNNMSLWWICWMMAPWNFQDQTNITSSCVVTWNRCWPIYLFIGSGVTCTHVYRHILANGIHGLDFPFIVIVLRPMESRMTVFYMGQYSMVIGNRNAPLKQVFFPWS